MAGVMEALEVFSQDFETAMEIWMYTDPVVERLYCDERRATRRHSVLGSQETTQSQFLSQLQSQSQSQRPVRKRRRRSDSRALALTPPLSPSRSLRMTAEPTQTQFVASPTQLEAARRGPPLDGSLVAASDEDSESAAWEATVARQHDAAVDTTAGKDGSEEKSKGSSVNVAQDVIEEKVGEAPASRVVEDEFGFQEAATMDEQALPSTSRVKLAVDTRPEEFNVVASKSSGERHVTPTPRVVGTGFSVMSGAKPTPSRPATSISPQLTVPSLFQTGSGRNMRVSKRRLQAYEEEMELDDANARTQTEARSADEPTVAGLFQTGSGKAVPISKAQLNKYEKKLMEPPDESVQSTSTSLGNGRGESDGDALLYHGADLTIPGLFQTGSGKNLWVSTSRLRDYESKLREDLLTDTDDHNRKPSSSKSPPAMLVERDAMVAGLFQTGSGKNLRVSASRLRDYEAKLCEDFPADMRSNEQNSASEAASGTSRPSHAPQATDETVVGLFQTGSGKNVRITASRLRDYEAKLLQDADVSEITPTVDEASSSAYSVASLFQTGSGKSVQITASKLRDYKAKLLQNSDDVDTRSASAVKELSPSDPTVVSRFQTGLGKSVRVSKAILCDYERKFQDSNAEGSSTGEEYRGTDDIKGVNRSKEITISTPNQTVASLFQTGSGKTVQISEKRLRDYESKLEKDEGVSYADTGGKATSKVTVSSLFQTGSGKSVHVGKDLLLSYESKFQQGDNDVVEHVDSSMPTNTTAIAGLFQTGLGKTVPVSKERLREFEAKLQGNAPDDGLPTNQLSSEAGMVAGLFQTGAGKNVQVSKERLREFEAKLQEDGKSLAEEPMMEASASLFQTGSGKSVRISKDKLREYEAKLREDHDDGASVGHSTQHEVLRDDDTSREENPAALTSDPQQDRHAIRRPPMLVTKTLNQDAPRASDFSAREFAPGKPQWTQRPPKPGKLSFRGHLDPRFDKENRGMETNPAKDDHGSAPPNALRKDHTIGENRGLKNASVSASITPSITQPPQRSNGTGLAVRQRHIGDKRKFKPPVPKANTLPRYPEVRSLTASRTITSHNLKRPRTSPASVPISTSKFRFKEVLKISFQHLQQLEPPLAIRSDVEDTPHARALALISASSATHVIFRREMNAAHLPIFHVRSSLAEPFDSELYMGMQEIYDLMASMDLLDKGESTSTKASGATLEWFANHFRWIVWKLAAMEIAFPRFLLGKYLTKDQVMFQMHRRVQRDIVLAERSVLKKMLNRDSSSLSCMVLCIAAVLPFPKRSDETLEVPDHFQLALVLTDGWYAVYAVPDEPLAAVLWRAHLKSSIVGTKIAVWNAGLRNSTEGIDPLECAIARGDCNSSYPWKNPLLASGEDELTQWPYLELHYNSTRRVGFGERLGAEQLKMTVSSSRAQRTPDFTLLKSVPLRSLTIGGGMVRSVRVVIKRISPILHLQSKEWAVGPRILTAEHMHTFMELRGRLQQLVQGDGGFLEDEERPAFDPQLPTPFIKFEVECAHVKTRGGEYAPDCAVLTVWRPRGEILSGSIREGDVYYVSSLSVGWKLDGDREHGGAFLRLSSSKGTMFQKVVTDSHEDSGRECIEIEQAMARYAEDETNGRISRERKEIVDVCVFVVSVTSRNENTQPKPRAPADQSASSLPDVSGLYKEGTFVQHAFVTDQSRRLMCLRIPSSDVSIGSQARSGNKQHLVAKSGTFTFRRGSTSIWREGAVVCLRGLEISHYDEKFKLLDCQVVESTQIVTFPSSKSHFSPAFTALQRAVDDDIFMAHAQKMKRFVDRRVLGMDIAPSQNEGEFDEVEHLTQELLSRHDHSNDVVASIAATQHTNAEQEPDVVVWEVSRIVHVLPLPVGSRSPCDNVSALALLSLAQNGDQPEVFRTVYLSQLQLSQLQSVLMINSVSTYARPSANKIVSDLNNALQLTPGSCRVSARRDTSARLLNSPRQWERANASFWVATLVEGEGQPSKVSTVAITS